MAGTNHTFDTLQSKTPIQLRTAIKEFEMDKAKITITYADGTSKKPMQPMTHGKSKEEILYCINAYMQNCDQYDLDNDERFEYFPQCVGALLYPTWTTAQQGQPRTNAGFRRAMSAFLKALQFHDDSFGDLTDYLDSVRKPTNMTVANFDVAAPSNQQIRGIDARRTRVYGRRTQEEVFQDATGTMEDQLQVTQTELRDRCEHDA